MHPPTQTRLVVVSHQLPWECSVRDGVPVFERKRGHSAQNSGITSLISKDQTVVNVGWMAGNSSSQVEDALLSEKACALVQCPDHISRGHYEGYCKGELWPLFHYVLWDKATNGQIEARYYLDYAAMNECYAQTIVKLYQEGDVIWIMDYHLLLLPGILRKLIPNAVIGFFLHTPFPSSEVFRCLPKRVEILSGILGSNLIGFQTYSHARHFISSCTRVLGLESSPNGIDFHGFGVAVGIFPIGIDLERVERHRLQDSLESKISSIREMFRGKKIIVGRDKLDEIQGVEHKFAAFERFLEIFPEWRDQVALIEVTSPAQSAKPATAAKVAAIVSRINGTYGSLQFFPAHHFHQNLDHEEYYALLTLADICLITSIRDGMNTMSHEYIICQQKDKGSLILSEFTGSAGSLSGAFLVNPWDYTGVAHAIHEALSLSTEERVIKHGVHFNNLATLAPCLESYC